MATMQIETFGKSPLKKQLKRARDKEKAVKIEGSSVYKRDIELPPAYPNFKTMKRFLVPTDETFNAVMKKCYRGFTKETADKFPVDFHTQFRDALEYMDRNEVFQFDITQPAGLNTKLARTFVTRCLVGDSGITYKYLGIRMFAYPWDQDDEEGGCDDDGLEAGEDHHRLGAVDDKECKQTGNDKEKKKGEKTLGNKKQQKGASGSEIRVDDTDQSELARHLKTIGKLNKQLIAHTEEQLRQFQRSSGGKKTVVGSCNFNLSLINRCYPQGSEVKLKDEPLFRNEKCTVSWHADSSLEHYSSIAVYQYTKPVEGGSSGGSGGGSSGGGGEEEGGGKRKEKKEKGKGKKDKQKVSSSHPPDVAVSASHTTGDGDGGDDGDNGGGIVAVPGQEGSFEDNSWRAALRVRHNAEGPGAGRLKTAVSAAADDASVSSAPAVAVPLENGSVYYLLDDFNHHHQHSVLAGCSDRYASTHRVSRTEGHTYWSIRSKCLASLQASSNEGKVVRSDVLWWQEAEFEWIRQFFIQGKLHYDLHTWWHQPIQELLSLWFRLSDKIRLSIQAARDAAVGVELDDEGSGNLSSADLATTGEVDESDDASDPLPLASCSRKQWNKRVKRSATVDTFTFDTLIEQLAEVHSKRDGWRLREADATYTNLQKKYRPLPVPFPTSSPTSTSSISTAAADSTTASTGSSGTSDPYSESAQKKLLVVIENLKKWRSLFVSKLSDAKSTTTSPSPTTTAVVSLPGSVKVASSVSNVGAGAETFNRGGGGGNPEKKNKDTKKKSSLSAGVSTTSVRGSAAAAAAPPAALAAAGGATTTPVVSGVDGLKKKAKFTVISSASIGQDIQQMIREKRKSEEVLDATSTTTSNPAAATTSSDHRPFKRSAGDTMTSFSSSKRWDRDGGRGGGGRGSDRARGQSSGRGNRGGYMDRGGGGRGGGGGQGRGGRGGVVSGEKRVKKPRHVPRVPKPVDTATTSSSSSSV